MGNNDLSHTGIFGKRTQPWNRRVLGLFAAVWLNLAIQPCAMALEQEHDCPHCPPAHEHEMAMHHGSAEAKAKPPCASMQAQCGELDDFSVDGRSGQLKAKDVVDLTAILSHEYTELADQSLWLARGSTDPPDDPFGSPPLHVLHCVYLD